MKKDKVKILFIGAGNIASQHLKVLDNLIDLKNCWIGSRTSHKSKKLAKLYSMNHVEKIIMILLNKIKKLLMGFLF